MNNLVELGSSDIIIGDGTGQRSRIDTLKVAFDTEVTLQPGAFSVARRGAGDGPVDVSYSTLVEQGRTVATLTLSGSLLESGSLVDGNYDLRIDASKVASLGGGFGLDSNQDGVVGDDFVFGDAAADAFFRLYGDDNGDGSVNLLDFARFRSGYGASAGMSQYLQHLDADDDGLINLIDFAAFRSRYGTLRVFE